MKSGFIAWIYCSTEINYLLESVLNLKLTQVESFAGSASITTVSYIFYVKVIGDDRRDRKIDLFVIAMAQRE